MTLAERTASGPFRSQGRNSPLSALAVIFVSMCIVVAALPGYAKAAPRPVADPASGHEVNPQPLPPQPVPPYSWARFDRVAYVPGTAPR